jgi:tricorn protease
MQGYYRFPSIHADTLVFVCEDDLWTVPVSGGVARRLTSGRGEVSRPVFSPDGSRIAFTGREEGAAEVTVMPAAGGELRRLTFLGALTRAVGWTPDGKEIVFASNARGAFAFPSELYAVPAAGGEVRALGLGPGDDLCFGPGAARVLGRNRKDPAFWKRYRGGTAGELWADPRGKGEFRRLVKTGGNLAWPMAAAGRVFFVSDHEGTGNLYSCRVDGRDLRRHTAHKEFYVRNPSTDGARIAYQLGAGLRVFDPADGSDRAVPVELRSPRAQRARRFVSADAHLEDWDLHPDGHSLAVVFRGKLATMGNWEGPAVQHGTPDGVRYRLPRWLADGKRLVAVTDEDGEERLEVRAASPSAGARARRLDGVAFGRATTLTPAPKDDRVLLTNHRNELLCVDLKAGTSARVDRSAHGGIHGTAWSPDGRWAAYSIAVTPALSAIRLWDSKTGKTHDATKPVLRDVGPAFDPDGKYLYFLSYREFDPVYDGLQFELGFPRGVRPYLLTLRRDLPSPFVAVPRALKAGAAADKPAKKGAAVEIDLDGLADRIVPVPVPEGRYQRVLGLKGKILFTSTPVKGSLSRNFLSAVPGADATLSAYDLESRETKVLAPRVTDFALNADGSAMAVQSGLGLRVTAAGEAVDAGKDAEGPGRKSGLVDLSRARASLDPASEWRQMCADAWRLQRDLFWNPGLKAPDWRAIYRRYEPLLDRVASRAEFSDLLNEMQGELGTSHAYVFGGDFRPEPGWAQGSLGAEFAWDPARRGWRVTRILRGDAWDRNATSPLAAPGAGVAAGDVLKSIDGRALDAAFPPAQALVHKAGAEVLLGIAPAAGGAARDVTVRALSDERPARYREWVERNRRIVREATGGRCGYIHVPNMGPSGYAEFHRSFLSEVERDGLVVDVRNNGGGHVSPLILEKLARRRIAWGASRWLGVEPYPHESPAGPMVALTDEHAGSDGDIFSHAFKRLGLGPLIGKRTWGGVIGIAPRFPLADGGVTTQPEFAFWFDDVGWGVENFGTEPDIEVEFRPQDHAAGRDPQMDRALVEIRKRLKAFKPKLPKLDRPKDPGPTLGVPAARRQV